MFFSEKTVDKMRADRLYYYIEGFRFFPGAFLPAVPRTFENRILRTQEKEGK